MIVLGIVVRGHEPEYVLLQNKADHKNSHDASKECVEAVRGHAKDKESGQNQDDS